MDIGIEHELRDLAHRAGLDASDTDALTGFLGLLADQPDTATDGELADAVIAHQHVSAVIAATGAGWQARWDSSLTWALDGARTGATWLHTHTPVSRTRAASQLTVAHALPNTPHVNTAARAGLGDEKTRLLLAARTPATAEAFTRDEAWLVDTVRGLTVDAARTFLARWHMNADPDGTRPNDSDRSHLHISPTLHGRHRVDGTLDPTDAATILAAVEARIDAWHHAGLLANDTRTRSQLFADALTEICAADQALPVRRRPTVLVHLHPDNTATIAGRGPIHPTTAARLTCTADLHRVVMSADGEVLDAGMAKRLATDTQWRALIARSHGHCEHPGCDVPHTWCQAHHLDPYRPNPDHPHSGTGPTDLANLALVCTFHHHLIHEGGHTLTRGPTGQLQAHDPHGRPTNPPHATSPPHQ